MTYAVKQCLEGMGMWALLGLIIFASLCRRWGSPTDDPWRAHLRELAAWLMLCAAAWPFFLLFACLELLDELAERDD